MPTANELMVEPLRTVFATGGDIFPRNWTPINLHEISHQHIHKTT